MLDEGRAMPNYVAQFLISCAGSLLAASIYPHISETVEVPIVVVLAAPLQESRGQGGAQPEDRHLHRELAS